MRAATLVDVVGSAALVTVSEQSGVSLSINVDYLRPGQVSVLFKPSTLSAFLFLTA